MKSDKDNLSKVYRWYQTGIRATNECIEKGYLSDEQGNKLKEYLTKDLIVLIVSAYVIPEFNKISSQVESRFSKGLERMFGKGLR